jgi:NAD(P)-dependent dehydrogenase (short-subunit alcohol dehydrogenase family)
MSAGQLSGSVAIVTGAGQGIGRGCALALADRGASVALSGRTLSKVRDTAEEIAARGGSAVALQCDVADRAAVEGMVGATAQKWGRVDILVNNAHAYRVPPDMDTGRPPLHVQAIEDLTDADIYGTFAGAAAMVACMQACFPYLKRQGGSIVNMGSPISVYGEALQGAYAMAKEAIGGITKVAAAEWGRYGIRVNVVAPAGMSPGAEESRRTRPDRFAAIVEQIPLGRIGDCEEDVGRAVAALVSPDMQYLTGATLMLDGGRIRLR